MRSFLNYSLLTEGNLALALAPALTPDGLDNDPDFFTGFAGYPQVLARGLLVLADITSTRYFNYTPVALRDPVLSAQGDRLCAECFSACNGVYARLDLLGSGFDGQIGLGTTNVDIGRELRAALTQIRQEDKLQVSIGAQGFRARTISRLDEKTVYLDKPLQERPVQMPERWVRALGNAAGIHQDMTPVFSVEKAQAQAFVAALPAATGKNQTAWLTPSRTGIKCAARRSADGVFVSGLHRLSALKRVTTNLLSLTFYRPASEEPGAFMLEAQLPGARLVLSLTAESWQGYSGEGALLASLAQPDVLEDASAVGSGLQFNAIIDELRMAQRWALDETRVKASLALLAASGKLGFDAHEQAWFHRELPDDPSRVLKDNPRLVAAQKLVDNVRQAGGDSWSVSSGGVEYRVLFNPNKDLSEAKCTCTWYLNHQNKRGPCKHILAVQLATQR